MPPRSDRQEASEVPRLQKAMRDADARIDALARLRAAMTPQERMILRWDLDTKQASLLRDLGRLHTAAALTASFLELRNLEFERSLAGPGADSIRPDPLSHLATNERSNNGHPCTTP